MENRRTSGWIEHFSDYYDCPYGGIGGLIDEKNVADSSLPLDEQIKSGKTLVIVPEGYEKAVMEENVFAGNAMKRRTNFQYGSLLDKGGKGSLSVGIGLTPSNGTTTYISPSYEVKKATETIKVDGVEMVFQLTPNTESPAEYAKFLSKIGLFVCLFERFYYSAVLFCQRLHCQSVALNWCAGFHQDKFCTALSVFLMLSLGKSLFLFLEFKHTTLLQLFQACFLFL